MKKILYIAALFTMFSACNQPECPESQTNPLLSTRNYDTSPYQQELKRLIRENRDTYAFYFEKRITEGDKDYLYVNCFGNNFCGTLKILVQNQDVNTQKLLNDKGYRGAQLMGLQWKALITNEQEEWVYTGLTSIID